MNAQEIAATLKPVIAMYNRDTMTATLHENIKNTRYFRNLGTWVCGPYETFQDFKRRIRTETGKDFQVLFQVDTEK